MHTMYLRTLSLIFLVTVLNVDAGKSKKVLLTAKQAQNIAIEAYIYGYSIITGEITRVQMTNVNERQTYKAPMGQFVNMRHYPSASFRGITTPNADTLYSTAWIDLDDEPWVFSHPDMGNRYFLFPMYDHWMPIIESPGTRTTGSSAATYLLTGPKWNGTLSSQLKPRITKHIRSPSRYLFILGRTYCLGTPEDYAAVHRLQDQYFLRPFSVFSSNKYQTAQEYNPPVPKVNLNYGFSMTDKVRDVINNMNITTYFNMLATLMKDNPPAKEDADIVKKMAQLGLIPGKTFDWKKLNRKLQNALKSVPKLAFNTIKSFESKSGRIQNGWTIPKIPDHYGTDYRLRAFIAAYGWPANLPEDAIYICTHVDSSGKKLSGKYNYTLRFPKGQTPPIKAFWSITMYDPEYFFVPNTLNKFTLSPRDPLVYNTKDGSLDLYFQHAAPDENKRANWLPSPQDGFILMLRMYWPQIQNSSWTIPPVKRV